MIQIEKEFLFKDLCGRLPYFVQVQIKTEIVVLNSICNDGYHFNFIGGDRKGVNIENIKPYLFPLSSMTEKQKCQYRTVLTNSLSQFEVYDWLNAHHFDYRGLIPLGLAIDATGLNIY